MSLTFLFLCPFSHARTEYQKLAIAVKEPGVSAESLKRSGLDLDAKSPYGKTLLHNLVRSTTNVPHENIRKIKLLVEAGADRNLNLRSPGNYDGGTPLHELLLSYHDVHWKEDQKKLDASFALYDAIEPLITPENVNIEGSQGRYPIELALWVGLEDEKLLKKLITPENVTEAQKFAGSNQVVLRVINQVKKESLAEIKQQQVEAFQAQSEAFDKKAKETLDKNYPYPSKDHKGFWKTATCQRTGFIYEVFVPGRIPGNECEIYVNKHKNTRPAWYAAKKDNSKWCERELARIFVKKNCGNKPFGTNEEASLKTRSVPYVKEAKASSDFKEVVDAVSSGVSALDLKTKGLNLNAKSTKTTGLAREGETPLHFFARGDDLKVVKTLVEAGADKNAKNKRGQTPLYDILAVDTQSMDPDTLKDYKKVVLSLVTRKNVNEKDQGGNTPFIRALSFGWEDEEVLRALATSENVNIATNTINLATKKNNQVALSIIDDMKQPWRIEKHEENKRSQAFEERANRVYQEY